MADETKKGADESGEDVVGDLGGIFGVASSGKKKKKKKKKEPVEAAPQESEVEESAAADDSIPFPEVDDVPDVDENAKTTLREKDEEPAPKKKKKSVAAVEGILTPGTEDSDLAAQYLNEDDLGDLDAPKNKTVPVLVGVIVVLLIGMVGMGIMMTGSGGDLVALFKGELREKRIQEAKMKEEAFNKEQKEKLDLFGNVLISGNPKYARIKLNGQTHYGRTSSGAWREVRIGAIAGIQNLKIKEDHEIEVSAPGFDPGNFQIRQGMWNSAAGGQYLYNYTASLSPKGVEAKTEFDARMSEDPENEFYGTVTLNTIPSGATVTFNNKPLLNEKGEELKTPVTFDKYWVKSEKTGKLEETLVRVDSTIDIGNKIELELPYENKCTEGTAYEVGKADGCCPAEATVATDTDCKNPKLVEALQREMWTCEWVDGAFPKEIEKKKTVQHYCNYKFTLDLDFNGLKSYIVERHEEFERIKAQAAEAKKKPEQAAKE